jgi:uncharacterized repeat protein (TIGR03803 family)
MKKTYFLLASLFFLGIGAASAQYTDMYDFMGPDGAVPTSTLTFAGRTLYGMTSNGGANTDGCIFAIDTTGKNYRDIYDFTGTQGSTPYGDLTLSGHKFYGTTYFGGAFGNGCVFSVDTNGKGYIDLHDFNTGATGQNSNGSLILSGGKLFGTTYFGGANGDGNIFSIDTNGNNYKDLFDFNGANGENPHGNLTSSLSGKILYGMTSIGGAKDSGVIFSIDTDGTHYKNLHSSNNFTGFNPWRSLVLSGNILYGTMYSGGANSYGTYFSVDTAGGGFRRLYSFYHILGSNVAGNLTLVGGVMYSVNFSGTANGFGNVFSIDTDGTAFTNIYECTGVSANPQGGIAIIGSTIYGTSVNGGALGNGNIFKLSNGVPTSVNQVKANNENVKVFPNPSAGVFTIESSVISLQSTVEVYNMLGEKVFTQYSIPSTQYQIDLTNQPAGIYLYRVIAENGELVGEGKMIIQ